LAGYAQLFVYVFVALYEKTEKMLESVSPAAARLKRKTTTASSRCDHIMKGKRVTLCRYNSDATAASQG
jgi:hypothetical protein